jgi:predicted RNase H-like HicB family nuclease
MVMVVNAVFEEIPESEGGGYLAYAEELPGAISEGDTLEEARENLRDAIELLLEANRELTGKRMTLQRAQLRILLRSRAATS